MVNLIMNLFYVMAAGICVLLVLSILWFALGMVVGFWKIHCKKATPGVNYTVAAGCCYCSKCTCNSKN